jgi:hypothetical protein
MNLKKYTRVDCKYIAPGKPTIRISKTGFISFNKSAVQKLAFKPDEKISIIQDELRPTDWYIQKTDDPDGFELRTYAKTSMAMNAAKIASILLDSLGLTESTTFRMATEPTVDNGEEYFAILTKVPQKNEK